MKRFIAITLLALTVSAGIQATRPLRRVLTDKATGKSVVLDKPLPCIAAGETERRALSPKVVALGNGLGTYGKSAGGAVPSIGEVTIPVVMVEFADRFFQETTTKEKVNRMLNEEGYADEAALGARGSVRDYFLTQSSGLFRPEFRVVAKVRAANAASYYGRPSGTQVDANAPALVREAVDLAAAQGVDFSAFAAGGTVPLVSIYFAGPGEQSSYETGSENYLWAHFRQSAWTSASGVRFGSYFVGNELLQGYFDAAGNLHKDAQGNYIPQSSEIDGMGIFVHEFGHALGLPDFYYTGSNAVVSDTLQTMNLWSVMDYGNYYYDGYLPVGYNAYERAFCGWLPVEELSRAGRYELAPLGVAGTGKAYLVRNDANADEYYLLENRQPGDYYPSTMGHGLLVLHVDYAASAWTSNGVNNTPSRQRVQYVPADGKKQSFPSVTKWDDWKGDLFPGLAGVTELSDVSAVKMTAYTGGLMHKPLYHIAEQDGLVSFSFLDATLTGIGAAADGSEAPAALYDLGGRRVNRAVRGIYISGGRKILVR